MKRCYLFIIMCNLLLAACGSDDSTSPANTATVTSGTQPIMFSAGMGAGKQTTTRATTDINDNNLSAKGGFGVFGCYTGLHGYSDSNVRPDFMYNEHVTYNETNRVWEYTPVKYWPNGEGEVDGNTGSNKHYVSFMAYAPYSDNYTGASGYCIPSFSLQGEIGNPWLTYRLHENVANQVDLLYAKHSNEHPILDQTKPLATDSKVLFDFNHALACVGDQVTVNLSGALKSQVDSRVAGPVTNCKVEVTGFEIEYFLTSKARLVLWNQGEANWQAIQSETPTCTRHVTLVDPDDPGDDVVVYAVDDATIDIQDRWKNQGVYYIPVELANYAQTATVTLTYRVLTYSGSSWKNEFEREGTAVILLREYGKAGEHIYINVSLNPMDISLTATISPWVEVDPVNVEGIEE